MSIPMLPEDMRGKSRAAATAMIEGAIDLAAERGIARFGLGAFTSIVTRGGESVVGRGVPITSGNTLTTVTAVSGLQRVAERVGIDLARSRIAVVGADGRDRTPRRADAGARCRRDHPGRQSGESIRGEAAAPRVGRGLCRRSWRRMRRIRASWARGWRHTAWRLGITRMEAEEMCAGSPELSLSARFERAFRAAGERPPVTCTTDIDAALQAADIVLVATSSEIAFVDPLKARAGDHRLRRLAAAERRARPT